MLILVFFEFTAGLSKLVIKLIVPHIKIKCESNLELVNNCYTCIVLSYLSACYMQVEHISSFCSKCNAFTAVHYVEIHK